MLAAFGIMMVYLLLFRRDAALRPRARRTRRARSCACCRPSTSGRGRSTPLVSRLRRRGRARRRRRRRTARPVPEVPPPPGAAARRGAPGGRARPLLGDAGARGHDAAARHRGDRRRGAGVGAAPADGRDASTAGSRSTARTSTTSMGVVEVRDLLDYEGDPRRAGRRPSRARCTSCPRRSGSRTCCARCRAGASPSRW